MKTYPFIYPTIGDLLDRLNVRDCLLDTYTVADDFWGADLLEALQRAAMEQIDELTLIAPRQLHLTTGIPAWRIDSIYQEAVAMIKEFHRIMDDDIMDIELMRKDRKRIHYE